MAITINILSSFKNTGFQRLEKELTRLDTPMQKIQATAKALGPAATVAFGALALGATQAIEAAEATRVADERLNQIATSMGLFGDETTTVTNRLKEYASQVQETTAIDDEQVKAVQAKLLTFKEVGVTADEMGGAMDRATLAAIDLAAAGFGTAETNATQLGKALQDPIKGLNSLSRAGVTFTEQEKEKIKALVESGDLLSAQNIILSAIETQVGGTAEATATGSAKMKVAFGELTEQIGMALLPVFDALVPVVTGLVNFMRENTGVVVTLGVVFGTLAAAVIGVNIAMYANPISLIIVGVGLLITAVVLLVNWLIELAGGWDSVVAGFNTGLNEVNSFFTTTWDEIKATVQGVLDWVGLTWDTTVDGIETGLNTMSTFFGTIFGNIGDGIRGHINGWIGIFEGFVNGAINGINGIIRGLNKISISVPDWVPGIGGQTWGINLGQVSRISIPRLAEGGIVMPTPGGVIANLAEAGKPEAVIPLDRLGQFGGGGRSISVTVNAGIGTDGTRVGQLIVDEIKKFERSSGPVFARA